MTFPAALQALDLAGLRLSRTVGHTPALERAVRRYSLLGQHAAIWLAIGAGGAAVDRRRRREWLGGAATVAAAYAANQAVKLAVRRPRPQVDGIPQLMRTPTQLSFPSAHAASSAAAAQAYARLLPAGPLRIAAAAMAASRLYLGVHWPSDIVAGALLGTVIGTGARHAVAPTKGALGP